MSAEGPLGLEKPLSPSFSPRSAAATASAISRRRCSSRAFSRAAAFCRSRSLDAVNAALPSRSASLAPGMIRRFVSAPLALGELKSSSLPPLESSGQGVCSVKHVSGRTSRHICSQSGNELTSRTSSGGCGLVGGEVATATILSRTPSGPFPVDPKGGRSCLHSRLRSTGTVCARVGSRRAGCL